MMRKILSTLMMAAAAGNACAQKDNGNFTYFLPKTEVSISLLIEKTTYTPGRLADYCDLYFKTKAQKEPEVSYRIVGMTFATDGVPDESKQYSLVVDKKHSILSIDCDRNGVLKAINTKGNEEQRQQRFTPAPRPALPSPNDYMSQDILSSTNLPKMAQMVAQEIYDIRDSRNQLSRGEAEFMPKDGEQLKIMLAQLQTQENALMQVFEGTTVTDTTEAVVSFVPDKENARQTVFRFSRHFGLTSADDLSGAPFYAVTEDMQTPAEAPVIDEKLKKQKDDMIIGVNIPGKIKIRITDGTNTLGSFSTYAAQFGTVDTLSGSLFGKKFTSQIVLDKATGGITNLHTEPLD